MAQEHDQKVRPPCRQCDGNGFVLDPVTAQPRECMLCAPKPGWDEWYSRHADVEHDEFISDFQPEWE